MYHLRLPSSFFGIDSVKKPVSSMFMGFNLFIFPANIVITDSGTYTFHSLAQGTPLNTCVGSNGRELPPTEAGRIGTGRHVDLRMQILDNETSRPLRDSSIFLRPRFGNPTQWDVREKRAGRDGWVIFQQLPEGLYSIKVSKGGFKLHGALCLIEPGDTENPGRQMTIRLTRIPK